MRIALKTLREEIKKIVLNYKNSSNIAIDSIVEIDSIGVFLKENDISFRIGWIAHGFRPPIMKYYGYPLEKVDCNCIHLKNGKIARCPIAQYIDYYNEINGTNFSNEDALIDIYKEELDFVEFYSKLCKSFEICNFCGFWRCDLQESRWRMKKN